MRLFSILLFAGTVAAKNFLMITDTPDSDNIVNYKGKYISVVNSNDLIRSRRSLGTLYEDIEITLSDWCPNRIKEPIINNKYDGTGVNVYVIDSGIKNDPNEYSSRILPGYPENDTDDCLGHGTHVSSIIGSKSYGLTKNVNIIPVRVFDCTINTVLSVVLRGIYWVIEQKRGIVNLSLNGDSNSILDSAIQDLIDAGFIVVSSAGNNNKDACNYSPGYMSIVTGCIVNGVKCESSNYGSCVTVYAPGQQILGLGIYNHTVKKSGTSMSAPYVSGIAAMLLQRYPTITHSLVKDVLISQAENGIAKIYNDDGPMCQVGKCVDRPLCRNIKNYGCKVFSFCGFKTRKECSTRKRCKYSSGRCQQK